MSPRTAITCACCALLVLSARAQAPPPVLRATTRLVEVNVVVHDRKGAPVADLTRGEFEIYDDGEKQQVATLRVERSQPPSDAPKPAPLPPNVFSNLPAYRPAAARAVTVVLMDGLNTAPADQGRARDQLIKFLSTLTPSDRVAIYTLGRDLRILHDFTDDAASLLRVLEKHGLYLGSELADSQPEASNTGDTEMDAYLDHAGGMIGDFLTAERVRMTLNAIQAIAGHVSALPGRKNLVWVSGGFPLSIGMEQFSLGGSRDRQDFSGDIEGAARAIAAAQVAIYPVDARGLMTHPDFGASTAAGGKTRTPPARSKAMDNILLTHETMKDVAKRTGGKAYYDTNGLKTAVRDAIDDARVTYLLGYYPTHTSWDGRFRAVTVKVTRPGLDVRHRLGYFAFGDLPATDQSRKAALLEASRSPLDSSSIGLSVGLTPDTPRPGSTRVLLAIEPRHLTLQKQGENWAGLLDVLFVMQGAPEEPPAIVADTMALNLTPQHYQSALKDGLVMGKDIESARCSYRLKVAVRDVTTGSVGSVSIRR
jgi:VWFA-related protein